MPKAPNKKKLGKKGLTAIIGVFLGVIAMMAVIGAAWFISDMRFKAGTALPGSTGGTNPGTGNPGTMPSTTNGVPIDSLQALQQEKYSKSTEGSNDLEFWAYGADVTDTLLSAREVLTLSSGAVTDTSVPNLRSAYTQNDMDLWVEGASAYYDKKVPTWSFSYNEQTGKGVLNGDGSNGAVEAENIGTFAALDTLDAVDTGVVASGSSGIYNYSNTTGDGTVYIRFNLGNDESSSVLKDVVLCIGDPAGGLEGNEITSISVSKYSGSSVGNVPSNMLSYFTQAAGTGSFYCAKIGDIVNDGQITKGVYQMDLTVSENNFISGEYFIVAVDDNGGYKARQFPSQNLKATVEDVEIIASP